MIPASRNTDPITSDWAEETTDKHTSARDVLAFLRREGRPVIQQEAELTLTQYTPQRVRTAFTQLERKGLVQRVPGKYGRTTRGKRAELWEATK